MSVRALRAHLLVGALAVALWSAGALEGIERVLMDARFGLLRDSTAAGVTLVAIDSRSLAALEVWPWSRQLHATVLENLEQAGAARVGFDIDFGSRSDPDDDAELARALERARPPAVLPVFVRAERGRLTGAGPLPSLAGRAVLGAIHVVPERDGSVRRYGGGARVAGAPSFARAVLGLPATEERYWLDASIASESITTISYVDVLTGAFDRDAVAGRPVIVGATAPELGDRVPIPLRESLAGPLVQALAVECERRGRRLTRSALPEVALTVLFAVGFCTLTLERAGWRRALIATALFAAAAFTFALAWQWRLPRVVDLAPAGFVVACGLIVSLSRGLDREALAAWLAAGRARRAESLSRRLIASSLDAIVVAAPDGTIESLNPAARTLLGDVAGRDVGEVLPAVRAGTGDRTARRADGTTFVAEAVESPVDQDDRRLLIVRDVSERRALERALEHQAGHDPLTGLANRRRLFACLEAELARDGVAFVLVDLDRFKEVNDALGHGVGDAVLQRVAAALDARTLPGECLGRLGGDEFGIVIPGAGEAEALARAEALRAAVSVPFAVDGHDVRLDASAGIAAGDGALAAESLVGRADVAMYVAKRAGTGIAAYRPQMESDTARERAIAGALVPAIAREELFLLFQPKVDARSGRIVGAEALVRWRHSELGPIPPGEFVPLAERRGGIRELTRFVLEASLRALAALRAAGFEGSVSANLSARNLREGDLVPFVEDLLDRYAVPPGALVLEVTESAVMDDPAEATRVLESLAALGVEIAVDDFGTGYSSLAYLGRLPAHEVKIDRAFVLDVVRDPRAERLVRGIVDMAHGLGLRVVAEGVENEATWNRLLAMGCDVGQGYLFGRPSELDALIEEIATTRMT